MNTSYFCTYLKGAVAGIALLGLSARADQQVSTPFSLPMHVNCKVDESDCDNTHGPTIKMSGDITLGGIKMRLIFQNNLKGTHTTTVVGQSEVVLLPLGGTITLPKQPVLGGVGGNPYIYLQFNDGEGNDLTDEFFLGRCVQGLSVTPDLLAAALAEADIHVENCSNKGGPYITIGGDITLSGLHAKLIFRNNVKGTHTAEADTDVAIILAGSTITIPKQPVLGGVGGNPIISIQFLNDDESVIGSPVMLGRCNQL